MTRTQAIDFLFQSWDEHDDETKGITEALTMTEGRYVVRDPQGITRCTTNRPDFANSARLQFSGVIYDRSDWRTNPVTLEMLNIQPA